MAAEPERIRIEELPRRFEQCLAVELGRGTATGRAAVIAFLDAASTELADWSPTVEGDGLLRCEIDSNAERIVLGLIRSMAIRDSDGEWRIYTLFNLQMAFARPAESTDSYAAINVGDEEGTETPEKFLEWLSGHPSVGPVLDSTPLEMEAYLD
jgi:hypothetical protein